MVAKQPEDLLFHLQHEQLTGRSTQDSVQATHHLVQYCTADSAVPFVPGFVEDFHCAGSSNEPSFQSDREVTNEHAG